MVAGTDAMDGYVLPGASLYEELSLFLEAGMSPMAALQSATINAAKFMGRQDSLGTIEVGKIADLVLLDADPLQAIENTRRIHTVIVDGKLFSPSRRQAMIAKMEAYAKAH